VWWLPNCSATNANNSIRHRPLPRTSQRTCEHLRVALHQATIVRRIHAPERNAPSGTSLTIRKRTASARCSRDWTRDRAGRQGGPGGPPVAISLQNFPSRPTTPPRSGNRLDTPETIVCGETTKPLARKTSGATGSSLRFTMPGGQYCTHPEANKQTFGGSAYKGASIQTSAARNSFLAGAHPDGDSKHPAEMCNARGPNSA